MTAPVLTEEQYRAAWAALQSHAWSQGHFSGVPRPDIGHRLVLEEQHPHKVALEAIARTTAALRPFVCSDTDVDEGVALRNQWYSRRLRRQVFIYTEHGQVRWCLSCPYDLQHLDRLRMLISTGAACSYWDLEVECRALERLQALVTVHQFKMYVVTGAFIETSARSQVSYVFRRLRPTLALKQQGGTMQPLAALCLHPLGYYEDTFAGALVPTDDVLAHLMLMRGDEHLFWRRSNQHQLWEVEAGV